MFDFVGQMGTYGWPMVILALVIALLVIRCALKMVGQEADGSVDINSVMILAGLVLGMGAYSHFSGLQSGLQMFGQFPPAMFAAGYAISLTALKFGLAVFILSGFAWFGLRFRLRQISAA
ncbi:MAG: hypothetical protein ACI80V_002024 [Rhodothermales bacterium]|jgi:hypothetical protein